jgi:hypothetical protein
VKLVCEALTDAKLLAAGPDGFWIWARGLLYAKQHLTDGVVPAAAMPLVAFGVSDVDTHVSKLVTLELWEPCSGGHRVPQKVWARYQTTAAHVEATREKRREAGKKGAMAKWQTDGTLPENDGILPSENGKLPNARNGQSTEYRAQSTDSKAQSTKHKQNTADGGGVSADGSGDAPLASSESLHPKQAYAESFERWYRLFPKKVGKQEAAAAFGRALKKIAAMRAMESPEALDWLCGVTEAFATSPKGRGEFVKNPASWLNAGHYDDDPGEWHKSGFTKKPIERVGDGQRFRE